MDRNAFLSDIHGRRFADVLQNPRIPFDEVLTFLSAPERIRRMKESEAHHDRPALAGVIKELEKHPSVQSFLSNHSASATLRFRQAVGVAVKVLMRKAGWVRTGNKGSLDHLSQWFSRAERYSYNKSS